MLYLKLGHPHKLLIKGFFIMKYGAKHRIDILISLVTDTAIKTQCLCSIPTNNVYMTLNTQ